MAKLAHRCGLEASGEGLLAGRLSVSINTDGFRDAQPQYHNAKAFSIAPLSNCTLELSHLALRGLERIFRPGFQYKRAGVVLDQLQAEDTAPLSLLADPRREQVRQLMLALDYCNARFGGDVVKVGLFPSSTFWRTKQQFAAPGYTVKWGEIITTH